ncbi:MAG: PilZ domain-containing protein [Zhongshania sp.]|uniref:PilZ domain-containing protein n=1 Tax=Zhongshania sp. TaxID=1971902 RepID=UPI0026388D19|nr:PilZ domain-containing protein [Zhongshania sp.]MDF1694016.1 PilZ domain-containing protein [Zhongshania sp.]
MREFVRHPSEIHMDVKVLSEPGSRRGHLHDVSMAGLSCLVSREIKAGSKVEFYVPSITEESSGRGTVMWCRPKREKFQLGIQFYPGKDTFRARIVEQLCQIEHYRREVEELEGRIIDSDEAAEEWIARYAADFDRLFSGE